MSGEIVDDDHLSLGIEDPVFPHACSTVFKELDAHVLAAGGGRENLHDPVRSTPAAPFIQLGQIAHYREIRFQIGGFICKQINGEWRDIDLTASSLGANVVCHGKMHTSGQLLVGSGRGSHVIEFSVDEFCPDFVRKSIDIFDGIDPFCGCIGCGCFLHF